LQGLEGLLKGREVMEKTGEEGSMVREGIISIFAEHIYTI
jgi:hypothetical protein